MVKKKWVELERLADLAFDLEMQKLAKLRAAEANLIEKRDKLAALNQGALKEFATVHPSHWQNGDFLWQTWLGRNVAEIGHEQARVRAQAEIQKPELRKAFGRKSVIAKIARD